VEKLKALRETPIGYKKAKKMKNCWFLPVILFSVL
jgi:hypothetical protein